MVDLAIIADACLGAFGDAGRAGFIRDGGTIEEVDAIYDSKHFEMIESGVVGASELVTTIGVRSAVVAERGTAVVVRSTSYTVKDIRPDSEGMKVLELEKA